ncbi:hypothetical protein [Maribacter sp. 4G9]|uniref:hypothetical protein n=1 Tax=Maribacter sp. 4G9 TaxID=1889777 RepID=UPI000C159FD0|nr:hypothetical protein [Maribacter sp. 4G9]PIB38425.1 hypothetical protein BFP75_16085 [Maribacter sp. 4G9]
MTDLRIHFRESEWEYPKKGVAQKVYSYGNRQLRLVRFEDCFRGEDWCQKGHIGYVLDGEMVIDFEDRLEHYKKGDGVWIEEGSGRSHSVFIEKNKFVELILFEAKSK